MYFFKFILLLYIIYCPQFPLPPLFPGSFLFSLPAQMDSSIFLQKSAGLPGMSAKHVINKLL